MKGEILNSTAIQRRSVIWWHAGQYRRCAINGQMDNTAAALCIKDHQWKNILHHIIA